MKFVILPLIILILRLRLYNVHIKVCYWRLFFLFSLPTLNKKNKYFKYEKEERNWEQVQRKNSICWKVLGVKYVNEIYSYYCTWWETDYMEFNLSPFLGQDTNPGVCMFSHLLNEDGSRTYLGLRWGLNECKYVRQFKQHMQISQCYINIWYYLILTNL